MANTSSEVEDDEELRPRIIHTYRDLFRNAGYGLEVEEHFQQATGELILWS